MYILGGRNTYDFFLGDQPGYQNYDWDILVCVPEGKKDTSLEQVRDYFSSVWKISDCKLYGKSPIWKWNPSENGRRRIAQTLQGDCKRASGLDHGKRLHRRDSRSEKDDIAFKSDACLCKRAGCFYEMTELMKQADHEVFFHTPYIICNDWMMRQLVEVCKVKRNWMTKL